MYIEKANTLKFSTKKIKNFKVLAFSIYILRNLKTFLKEISVHIPEKIQNFCSYGACILL